MTPEISAADELILAALRAGHQTVPAVAAYCRIEVLWARQALAAAGGDR